MSDVHTEESINNLSWNDVRSLCKQHGILVKGKKSALVAKLIRLLVHKTDLSESDMNRNETGRSTSRMTDELETNNEMSVEISTDEKREEKPLTTDSKHDELNLSCLSDSTLEETNELTSQVEESYAKEVTLPIDEPVQMLEASTADEKMDIPELNDDELETVKESSSDDSLLPANETFTIEDEFSATYVISDHANNTTIPIEEGSENQSRPSSAMSHREEGGNYKFMESLPQMEMARSNEDGNQMEFKCSLLRNVGTGSVPQTTSRLPRSNMTYKEKMAQLHQKEFEQMDSIKKKRAQTPAVDRLFKGLPSSPRSRTPSKDVFRVDNNEYVSISPTPFRSANNTPRALPIVRRPKEDAKALSRRVQQTRSKRLIPATVPDISTHLDQLATPKNSKRPPIPPERRAFTPKTGPYMYTDTTKMSDVEFEMYKRRERLRETQEKNRL
ncbi:hypothetical protein M3Y98_00115400 [Aphelenchoides besseyi]|nr:hypothetical protein M3Y98_00115400 [Aphelenchoides besseyi]